MAGFDERRERVLDGSARVFALKGYERASIRDIAAMVNMSPGGLYHYCSSKQDLLYQVCERAFQSLITRLEDALKNRESPADRLYAVFLSHLSYFLERPEELVTLTENLSSLRPPGSTKIRVLQRQYYLMVRGVVESLPGVAAVPLRVATMALFGSMNWVHTWYRRDRDGEAEEMAGMMAKVFLCGLAPNSDCVTLVGPQRREDPRESKEAHGVDRHV